MNWISNVVPPKIRSFPKRETPENLWVTCPDSAQPGFHKELEANLYVVPGSNYHMLFTSQPPQAPHVHKATSQTIATHESPADSPNVKDR